MKQTAVVLLCLVFAVTLASCTTRLEVRLFNNTGETIVLVSEGRRLVIEPRLSDRFYYPSIGHQVRLSSKSCEYFYELPDRLDHNPRPIRKGVMAVQVEQDFSVWVLPPTATGVTPVADIADQQFDGFALHLVSKTCG